ncbi:MAG: SPFH domain-containing protein [Streptosporangiaceae bacterium]
MPVLTEKPANAVSGWAMVGVVAVLAGVGIGLIVVAAVSSVQAGTIAGTLLLVAASFLARGLTPVAPGQPRVVQLQGRYVGTIRAPGLQWANPLARRIVVSTRVRSHETKAAKVNDADGNPIQIAAVLVWRVEDTARAQFGVDNLLTFVAIQAETAVRHIALSYPYDGPPDGSYDGLPDGPYDRLPDGQVSLRQNAEQITAELATEIVARVRPAGVAILEARLTQLSYAPEIAGAMLRRQQAGAVIAARALIVDGAVGMVESALARLDAGGAVELNDERRAAMASNLLTVLCSEQPTVPVVNTGTLY